MNLEKILDRIQEIEASITEAISKVHVLHGHKAEAQHWIQKIHDEENKNKNHEDTES